MFETDTSLIPDFIAEATEHLEEMESCLLQLEANPQDTELLGSIFRCFHTIKGAAQFVGLERTSILAHKAEDLLDLLRQGERPSTPPVIDVLIQTKDRLDRLLTELDEHEREGSDVEDLVAHILGFIEGTREETVTHAATEGPEAIAKPEEFAEQARADTSLIPDFIAEAEEHLEEMESCLLQLEMNPQDTEVLDNVFRCFHTIKGAAQFVGLERTSILAHKAEDLLDLLRQGKRSSTPPAIDVLIQTKDRLDRLLAELDAHEREESDVEDLIARMLGFMEETHREDSPEPITTATAPADETAQEEAVSPSPTEAADTLREPASVPQATAPEEDDYNEELDQELFGIFQNQLTEEILALSGLIGQLTDSETPDALLADCATRVERLRTAANYMGYEALVGIYDQWLDTIESQQGKTAGQLMPGAALLDDYIERVAARFPQLSEHLDTADQAQAGPAETAVETPPPVSGVPSPATPPPSETQETSAPLLDALSSALEQSLARSPQLTTEPMEAVFDEMLGDPEEMPDAAPASMARSVPPTEPTPEVEADAPSPPASTQAAPEQRMAPPPEKAAVSPSRTGKTPPAKAEASPIKMEKAPAAKTPAPESERTQAIPAAERALKKSVRVDAEKIDTLMNQVGELIVHRSYFNQIFNEARVLQQRFEAAGLDPHEIKAFRTLSYRFSEAIVSLSRTANELQEGVMKVRMLPISQLFNRYPRLVHDLVRNSDKRVRIDMRGEDTELDKMIIEEVSDPLIHIIRNAVDHGFESAEERRRLGKPETGTLLLEAYHESNHIVIEASDDGRGIDYGRVRDKAIEKELITSEDAARMPPRELLRLIMAPGFSTAETVTSTSGRGVGMDVVRKNVEKLNGLIDIDSEVGQRTRFRLKIPLTLAIISALQVRVEDNHFTIPLANVEETLRVSKSDTTLIEGIEVIHLRGRTMPIFRLASLFGLQTKDNRDDQFFVVVVNTGNEQVGLVVDELLGQDEVVIKPLVDYLQEGSGFSGATIIGDGRISLILDVFELVKMTTMRQANFHKELAEQRRYQMHRGNATFH